MRDDEQGPMTLAINDSQMDLHVISFTGQEVLNQPYRFNVDLISQHPGIDCASLRGCGAWLCFGPGQQGIHGQISEIERVHAGDDLSLYRITLMPDLYRLANTRRARTFNGMSVPQIIRRLLADHGLRASAYRFDAIIGLYPAREICVQYHETDLHLLQRLCEEEGITFRFEHSVNGHVLVFADDPAKFPELMQSHAVPVLSAKDTGLIGIRHFAEQLCLRPSYSSHACENLPSSTDFHGASSALTVHPTALGTTPGESARQRQVSIRTLERLRCERRVIKGQSNQPALVSGQIMRVTEHPDRMLNDQWLLTEVRHEGAQLASLKGGNPDDIAAIIRATQAIRALNWQTLQSDRSPPTDSPRTSACQYRNEFAVIPWAMPFRPPLKHYKPEMTGAHTALLSRPHAYDAMGRLALRFTWQSAGVDEGGEDSWVALRSAVQMNDQTTAVSVRFFDDDPDQPVICDVLPTSMAEQARIRLQRKLPAGADPNEVLMNSDERLDLYGIQSLTLHTSAAVIEITAQRVRFSRLNDA